MEYDCKYVVLLIHCKLMYTGIFVTFSNAVHYLPAGAGTCHGVKKDDLPLTCPYPGGVGEGTSPYPLGCGSGTFECQPQLITDKCTCPYPGSAWRDRGDSGAA